jgi:putative ABC transport system permease protein
MNLPRLVWRNLAHHWRGNCAVFLGVAVGTAVLTGALLVGDSLRGSLHDLTLKRLGWVEQALVTGRFFSQDLAEADELPAEEASPAILLQGAVTSGSAEAGAQTLRRAGHTMILGVNERFWPDHPPIDDDFWQSDRREVVLNRPLADELKVKPGATVTVHLQKVSAIPREMMIGDRKREKAVSSLALTVRAVLEDNQFGADFALAPSPAAPRNAFVPLQFLQDELNQDGRVNALFVKGARPSLQEELRNLLTLDDWGVLVEGPRERTAALFRKLSRTRTDSLKRAQWLHKVPKALADRADPKTGVLSYDDVVGYYKQRPYISLGSRQAILEETVADAAARVAKRMSLRPAPTLVYLVNNIAEERQQLGAAVAALAPTPVPLARPGILYYGALQAPYSIVAALDPALPAPLGPFLPPDKKSLQDDEIVLVDWPGWEQAGMGLRPNERVAVTYYQPDDQGNLREQTASFRLAGTIPLQGAASDPDLTPEFPGITDKPDMEKWADDAPFPYDRRRVKAGDVHDLFWKDHRTTPKAYVTLKAGQQMWSSRFGKLTSIRLAAPAGADLDKTTAIFRGRLLAELQPEDGGFIFEKVRERGLAASERGTDFRMLFLGFSFFLIAAALLLVGLLFRLNLDLRAGEIGLLLATGYRPRTVRRLLLVEGGLVAAAGGLLGALGAVGYAWGLLEFLRAHWPGSLERSFLRLHVTYLSLAIGYFASLVVSVLTIAWAVRILGKVPPSALLAGETTVPNPAKLAQPPRWGKRIAAGSLIGGLALIIAGRYVKDAEAQAGTFFTAGFLLLTAGLAGAWVLLRRESSRAHAAPRPRIGSLGVRNAGRHAVRSLLTAGLLATAAFLIVAVESFRRQPERDFLDKSGGSGGFALLGEADVPIYQDLNSGPGRDEMVEALELRHISPDKLHGVSFYPLRLRTGDDASCLNLYQPGRPRLLGVPSALVSRGGFQFADTLAKTPEENANPWLLLQQPADGGALPVFGEANAVAWMLKSKLGGVIEVPDDQGRKAKLRIVGLLKDSAFQSELLMSEANFLKLYPGQGGYNFFLIAVQPQRGDEVKGLLETALADHGFEATSTEQRLASYLAVENTYLSTFQALGGLGLLLGALGLAVVLLRSVWERRGELALLRALGFRRRALGWLVLAENGFLLAVGLGVGAGSALLAVAPHVIDTGANVPWLRLLGLLGLVLGVGLTAGAAAMAATVRAPLLPALRRE